MGDSPDKDEQALPILYSATTPTAEFHAAVWSRVHNSVRDARLPRAVVKPTRPGHVVTAVRIAAREGWRVSVRSGGHSWAAWSVRDEALLIDLGDFKGGPDGKDEGIEYDAETGVVSCSPSLTGLELNEWLGVEGRSRFFAGGHCPDVGLGGFILQGGMGWNAKNWGWASESLVGIDVVTADARELHCTEAENPDLFWAARGAGPGFPAIVTRFHLKTRPATGMWQSLYFYPVEHYRTVMQWVIDIAPTADPETEIVCLALYPPFSKSIHILANFLTFQDTSTAAITALAPLHASRPPGAATEVFCTESSLEAQCAAQTAAAPANHRFASENAYISNDRDAVAVLERAFTTLPNRQSSALYFSMNPVSRRTLPDMALSLQSDHYFAAYAVWPDEGEDDKCQAWVRDVIRGVERDSVGSYLGDADFRYRKTRFWGAEEGKKLMEIRKRWDPEGRICGFLDGEDGKEGSGRLENEFEWEAQGTR